MYTLHIGMDLGEQGDVAVLLQEYHVFLIVLLEANVVLGHQHLLQLLGQHLDLVSLHEHQHYLVEVLLLVQSDLEWTVDLLDVICQ